MVASLLHLAWLWHRMVELMDYFVSGLLRANTSSHAVLFCSVVTVYAERKHFRHITLNLRNK